MCAVQLEVLNITKTFESGLFTKTPRSILENISFEVQKGRTFGIVGDSGAGKTTLGKIIAAIKHPTAGEIYFLGNALARMRKEEFSYFRRKVQMLFQDPEGSLNPNKTIKKSLDEILNLIKIPQSYRKSALENILQTVGISSEVLLRHPNQISGGQNQRHSPGKNFAPRARNHNSG